MAEVIGLAASAVTLAALFSNCIDCFSYFKAAQNCSAEAETLLLKLDCEKARLLVWANTVGILRTDHQGRYPQLTDLELEILIRRCINQIISLLTDAQKLQAGYGGRPTVQQEHQRSVAVLSANSMSIFRATKNRFFARFGGPHITPTLLSRIKWAIRDGVKFRILLAHLNGASGPIEGHPERPWVGVQESISRIKVSHEAEHRAVPWEQVNYPLNQIESLLRAERENDAPTTRAIQAVNEGPVPNRQRQAESPSYAHVAGRKNTSNSSVDQSSEASPRREVQPIKTRLPNREEVT